MLKAVGLNIIIQDIVEPEGEKTKSGIFIPKYSSISQVKKAKVIDSEINSIKKGDIILYMKNSGMSIVHNNKEYIVIQEQNIVAKIEEGE